MTEPDHVSQTRAAYDQTADLYVQRIGTEISAAIEGPVDRALLGAFVELMANADGRLVADVGCGPGRVAALLAAAGLNVIGFDASPVMVDAARRSHPSIRFEVGLLTDLPVATGSLAGAVCWYSIIHTPPEHLDAVSAELHRALAPGAHLLVAFQAGDGQPVHRSDVQGRAVSLTSYRHDPEDVARRLAAAGLPVHARTVRAAEAAHESTPQAFLLCRSDSPDRDT